MLLADSLPASEKESYIERHLVPFNVLYLPCAFTKPPKNKYLLLACEVDIEPLFFVINSNINNFNRKNPDLHRAHVLLKASDNKFLEHDSYLNCNEVKTLDYAFVRQQLIEDTSKIKGLVSDNVRGDIIAAVKYSKLIEPIYKKHIINAMEP